MAKMDIRMPEEFTEKLSNLGNRTDAICEEALKAGAEVVLDKVRGNLASVIGSGTKYDSRSTGELQRSLGVSPVKVDQNSMHNIKIGFNEPRSVQYAAKGKRSYKQATNAMIANVIEYGKHGQPAKPFLKPAKTASKKDCIRVMQERFEEEVGKL